MATDVAFNEDYPIPNYNIAGDNQSLDNQDYVVHEIWEPVLDVEEKFTLKLLFKTIIEKLKGN